MMGRLVLAGAFALASTALGGIQVPRVEQIEIDGQGADWGGRGTRVNTLAPFDGPRFAVKDFDAQFRLGWDSRGLLLLTQVRDATHTEAETVANLWQADCLELFIADKVGGQEFVQFMVAPGLDAKFSAPRQNATDHRSEALRKVKPEVQFARVKTEEGYTAEVLIPWALLGRQAKAGDVVGFQFYASTQDEGTARRKLIFYPVDGTHETSSRMYELVLSQDQAMQIQMAVNAKCEHFGRHQIELFAPPAYAGQRATVRVQPADGEAAQQGEVVFSSSPEGRAVAKLNLPAQNQGAARLSATVGGQEQAIFDLPDISEAKSQALLRHPFLFKPAVFAGTQFPEADFENPLLAERLIGPYEISYTFYDRDYQKVSSADKPGRYGAVVEIKTESGRTYRRFRTLYRIEKPIRWWEGEQVRVNWPDRLGVDPVVAREQAGACDEYLGQVLLEGMLEHGMLAELLVGLHETKAGTAPATIMADPYAMDRAWWITLKRKVYGTDQRFTTPLARPAVVAGTNAPMLRPGTDQEAGFVPGTREKLEALLKEWAADSDEAFTACVARNGVVVIDGAYGTRDGAPMTVRTPSIVFSISKAISGTAFMMAVDQGLVSLDDTPAKFLPPFEQAKGRQPTMSQLFTHTAGMNGHWGDEENDFEELIADHLPYLKVGQRHEYNGASIALACKVLEQLTGESLPEYYARHLFGPLEMKDTASTSCSWRTWSTAADLAKLGQMLLNQGAYGEQVFFSKETFAKMTPHKLTKELGPETGMSWGIGLTYMSDDGTTLGHGSASSSTFFVIPSKNLVITMARNGAGKNFEKYHKQFVELIKGSSAE